MNQASSHNGVGYCSNKHGDSCYQKEEDRTNNDDELWV